MRYPSSVLLPIVAALSYAGKAAADCQQVDGNYYCSETSAVCYKNVGYSGSYSDVTNMDEDSGKCSSESLSVSGTMAPLDEELSVHFRGPLKLAQFGVYYPSGSSKKAKRDANADADAADCPTVKHVHHKHKRAIVTETVNHVVSVYANGDTVVNSAATAAASSAAAPSSAAAAAAAPSSAAAASSSDDDDDSTTSKASTAAKSSSTASSSSSSSGAWSRAAYFEPGSGSNVTFLNHQGGTAGSGTWSASFGNSLSYCASDGKSGASSSEYLGDVTVSSNTEFLIMSADECSGDDCGYYRADIPAYHGFGGASKIFVFEFEMPSDSDGSSYNQDMPAIWLLNAKIPRTLQYGDSSCSCWSTGCGELDLFEILSAGSDKLISHLHDGQGDNGSSSGGGGSQDYFARPTSGTMKAAVIFNDGDVTIVKLDDDTDFGSSLSEGTVSDWLSASASEAILS